eukprot:33362-Rhodomonas_salina.3
MSVAKHRRANESQYSLRQYRSTPVAAWPMSVLQHTRSSMAYVCTVAHTTGLRVGVQYLAGGEELVYNGDDEEDEGHDHRGQRQRCIWYHQTRALAPGTAQDDHGDPRASRSKRERKREKEREREKGEREEGEGRDLSTRCVRERLGGQLRSASLRSGSIIHSLSTTDRIAAYESSVHDVA